MVYSEVYKNQKEMNKMGKVLTRKIARNKLRNKYGNKGLNAAFKRYQGRKKSMSDGEQRGKNYCDRDYRLVE